METDQDQAKKTAPPQLGASAMQRVAREVNKYVAKFHRRYGWRADEVYIRGVAWEIALDALQHYVPEKGSVGAYVGPAIDRNLATQLLFDGSPVSEAWHKRKNLAGVFAAPLDALENRRARHEHVSDALVPDPLRACRLGGYATAAADTASWADEVLDDRRWRVRVLARLYEVVGEEGRVGLDELLERNPPRAGKVPDEVRASISVARKRVAADPELRREWLDKP